MFFRYPSPGRHATLLEVYTRALIDISIGPYRQDENHTSSVLAACMDDHPVNLCSVQALEAAPPPKIERVHDSMSRPFHDFAKEAEKLSPLAVMSEQTKVCVTLMDIVHMLQTCSSMAT